MSDNDNARTLCTGTSACLCWNCEAARNRFLQEYVNTRVTEAVAAEREALTEFAERILLQHTQNVQGMTGDEPEYEENTDAQDILWKRGERLEFSKRVSVAAYKLQDAEREACAKMVQDVYLTLPNIDGYDEPSVVAIGLADAIRARGG